MHWCAFTCFLSLYLPALSCYLLPVLPVTCYLSYLCYLLPVLPVLSCYLLPVFCVTCVVMFHSDPLQFSEVWQMKREGVAVPSFKRIVALKEQQTSTAGVHQIRPFCRHSFIIIIIIIVIVIVVGHSKSFQPRKPQFSSFENNTGPSDRPRDGRMDGHGLLKRCVVASKNIFV